MYKTPQLHKNRSSHCLKLLKLRFIIFQDLVHQIFQLHSTHHLRSWIFTLWTFKKYGWIVVDQFWSKSTDLLELLMLLFSWNSELKTKEKTLPFKSLSHNAIKLFHFYRNKKWITLDMFTWAIRFYTLYKVKFFKLVLWLIHLSIGQKLQLIRYLWRLWKENISKYF